MNLPGWDRFDSSSVAAPCGRPQAARQHSDLRAPPQILPLAASRINPCRSAEPKASSHPSPTSSDQPAYLRICLAIVVALSLGILQATSLAQTSKPSLPASDQSLEGQSLRISDSDVKAAIAKPANPASVGAGSAADLTRIFIALAAVVGLILLLRAMYRRLSGAAAGRGGKLVTVLSRSFISPKQQVLVLEVGKRLLIVGDSGGHMNSLCEITDPDEIAMLISRSRSTATEKATSAFASVFRRANDSFDEQTAAGEQSDASMVDPDEAVSSAEIGGLLDKVRLLQRQFNETKQVASNSGSVQ